MAHMELLKLTFPAPIYRVRTPSGSFFEKEESPVLQLMRRRLQGEREAGFTLIELMVVVLIIAILIAIAIPTFLGARQRAQDRAAQSNLRNALTAAKSVYTDKQTYLLTVAELQAVEPSLTFQTAASASAAQISVADAGTPSTATVFYAAGKSASGTCFFVADNVGAAAAGLPQGTSYQKSTTATCTPTAGSGSFSYTNTGW
jgi:type IV pilus assembly protein PilA